MAETEETGVVEESGISMVELLEEEEERELDAAAVLGPADDTKCTYDRGYKKRQALYACLTCCPADKGHLAGVCLACSYHCHEDHELVELYTKRNFCCDCGNSKFPQSCKLMKDKSEENSKNKYNHNFRGAYCSCGRPYPDPEDTTDDEMIQCCICEDWYHGRHQGGTVPAGDDYSEMVCSSCLTSHHFLAYYAGLAVTVVKAEDNKEDVAVGSSADHKPTLGSGTSLKKCGEKIESSPSQVVNKAEEVKKEAGEKSSSENGTSITQLVSDEADNKTEGREGQQSPASECSRPAACKLKSLTKQELPEGALFLPDSWRKNLCTCDDCKCMYDREEVLFLLDEEDTVQHYEESGKVRQHRNPEASVQRELEALSSLDRVTRTEMVHEYNTLSSSLRDYLRKFAENKKVVRDEDIREFFSQLAANKKQRPSSSIQLFCK